MFGVRRRTRRRMRRRAIMALSVLMTAVVGKLRPRKLKVTKPQ